MSNWGGRHKGGKGKGAETGLKGVPEFLRYSLDSSAGPSVI